MCTEFEISLLISICFALVVKFRCNVFRTQDCSHFELQSSDVSLVRPTVQFIKVVSAQENFDFSKLQKIRAYVLFCIRLDNYKLLLHTKSTM